MRQLIRKLRDAENGIALVWFATTLVLLIGTAGFAVDLGWLYLNSSRTQRSADAAATAGVVHLPGFPANADLDARDAARANGYDVCDPLQSGGAVTLSSTPRKISNMSPPSAYCLSKLWHFKGIKSSASVMPQSLRR